MSDIDRRHLERIGHDHGEGGGPDAAGYVDLADFGLEDRGHQLQDPVDGDRAVVLVERAQVFDFQQHDAGGNAVALAALALARHVRLFRPWPKNPAGVSG
jgi:hypothetical protein